MAASDRMRKDTTTFGEMVEAEKAPATPPKEENVDSLFNRLELIREQEGLYRFRYAKGGVTPEELSGRYTHIRFAEAAKADWERRNT